MPVKYKQKIVRRVVTKGNPGYGKNIKKNIFRIFFLIVFFTAGYGIKLGYDKVSEEIEKNKFFEIKEITVNTKGKYVSSDSIKEQSGLKPGINIFSFRTKEVENKLKSTNSEIKEAKVTRWFPDKISINIEERVPMGIYLYNGNPYEVDSEGVVFNKMNALTPENVKLPLFTGIKVTRDDIKKNRKNISLLKAIQIVEHIKKYDMKFLDNISEINMERLNNIILYTFEKGLKIKIGNSISKEKLKYINTVLASADLDKAKYIDIRFNKKAFVGY
ncbi:MAG: FtsQ-type POTRA domain-containing protein [Candidatus Firestonebacteria bacterium]|nr:FtsQ-type POTRA domain-containing protein [Candidatus Firestonebacteria bacterium]